MERVEEIIDSYGCQRHHLIAIMQDIQAEYKSGGQGEVHHQGL